MVLPHLPEKIQHQSNCYRNIATIKESQDLFDDLAANPADIPVLQKWADGVSGIDHQTDAKHRAFQYGDASDTLAEFDEEKWYFGRFGDGKSFGVWYAALERETSVREVLFWQYRNVYKPMIGISQQPIIVDRRMLEARCTSRDAIDLRRMTDHFNELTHDSDYSFCQALGAHAVKNKIDLFLTPSARYQEGTCVPIFNSKAILSTKTLYYLHFQFNLNGEVKITTDHDEVVKIPADW